MVGLSRREEKNLILSKMVIRRQVVHISRKDLLILSEKLMLVLIKAIRTKIETIGAKFV